MGSCCHLRFAAIPVVHAPAPATKGAGEARLTKGVTFLKAPELKDWS